MKKLFMTYITALMLFTTLTIAGDKQEVENFVSRFYTEVLGRTADTAGLADWTNRLISGESAGSDVATGFVFSKEFMAKPEYSDDGAFVTILYSAFFNRYADTDGLNSWLTKLAYGTSKKDVLDGFLYSQEFANLCKAYGIKPVPDKVTGGGVEDFVKRFYAVVLGRTADAAGLSDWVNRLNTKVATGADIATGFVFSSEFDEASKDDDAFLKVLYKAFFNRAADEGGLNGWLSELSKGTSRQEVLNGFLHSDEFVNLCKGYGILAYSVSSNSVNTLEVPTFNGNSQGKLVIQCEDDVVYYIMAYDCLRGDTDPSVTTDNGIAVTDEKKHVGEVFYVKGHVERTKGPVTITGEVYSGGKTLYTWPNWIQTCP